MWALFPGDVAYVWHGALHATTVAESLVAAGFAVRSRIIWAKDRLVLSRGDYHWQHEPCWYAVKKTGKGHWAGDRKQTTLWHISGKDQDATSHPRRMPVLAPQSGCAPGDRSQTNSNAGPTEVAKPMIENSERGITINKALAWTMLVSVTGLIWWGGGTLASLQSAADRLTSALTETREMIMAERASSAQLEARVRALENSATRQDERFDALSLSFNELKQQARETNALLRELAQRP